ncbi:retron system putative HNH endonuclease [Myxococcus sp. RHSTA-1-4]|uniref:retron system putative HNH endonuclease n=1 Tax=Myxococcus sp. RHSTA-1-4 TaxID=2874601 RepID=UPI001CBE6F14
MRPIVRSAEPASFKDWKARASARWRPTWENLKRPEKPEVLSALLRDQGYVCCYCERRIDPDRAQRESHIEHLQPRHHAPELALEFSNLLACCQAGLEEQPRQVPAHCGHLKGDTPIEVHPLMRDCRDYFVFDSAGGVRPNDADPARAAAARRTIDTLGLDIPKLVAQRNMAIEAVLPLLQDDAFGDDALRAFLAAFDGKDAKGHHSPFATAVVQVLSGYLMPERG